MAIFRRIWAAYAVLLFLLLMAFSLPYLAANFLFLPPERALRLNIYYLHHIFTPGFLFLIGIRLEVTGKEYLKPDISYVLVSNHRSSLDFIVNAAAFPGIYRYLAKQELQRIPVFGWVVKKMCLIVDRSDAASRAKSVMEMKEQLKQGWSVFVYPEGGRNRYPDKPLMPFYDGAFRLAVETGAPLAVQTLLNIPEVAPTGSQLQPGKVRIAWSEPIPTEGLTTADVASLKTRVFNLMTSRLT